MKNSKLSSTSPMVFWQERLRRHPEDPYAWGMVHRRIGGEQPQHLPIIADLLADQHRFVVVMKSAQVGASEALINVALHAADTGYAGRGNVLYAMPVQNAMDDFVQARIDPAIQQSEYLRGRLRPEPPARRGADSKRLKGVGPGYIYLRGTDSKRQIASMDCDLVILDEYDQMADGILALARKRIASSRAGRIVLASTPRFPEAGIHAAYLASDQRRYFIPCHHCGELQALDWPDNIDPDRQLLICRFCRKPIQGWLKGEWRPTSSSSNGAHGYHLSRLYSPWVNIPAMLEASRSPNALEIQEFQNSDLGIPYVPPGGGLTLGELDDCRESYRFEDYDGEECVAGIDVGHRLHIVVRGVTDRDVDGLRQPRRLWWAADVAWEDLGPLFQRFNISAAVIDAQPEYAKAKEFAERTEAWISLASYVQSGDHEISEPRRCRLNRTLAIDELVAAFRNGNLALPESSRQLGGRVKDGLGDYLRQLMAPQRIVEPDANGNLQARWREGTKADHYAHAEVYANFAFSQRPAPWPEDDPDDESQWPLFHPRRQDW